MATLSLVGENEIQVTDAEQTPSLGGRIEESTNKDSCTDDSAPITPSRATGLAANSHSPANLSQSTSSRFRQDSVTTAKFDSSRHSSPLTQFSRSVSSIGSTSSAISNFWDSPQTPCCVSDKVYDLTPLTPPTPLSQTGERVLKILTPCKISKTGTILAKSEAGIVHAKDQDDIRETQVGEEDFVPKKLFRNLTIELKASTSS